jgi:hypothetical protein
VIGPRDIGKRVHTHADVDGELTGIRRTGDGLEVAHVALDGHTYGPGRPHHSFPIGTVWLVEPEPAGPSWYPTSATPADAPDRQYGDDWSDELSIAWEQEFLRRQHDESS